MEALLEILNLHPSCPKHILRHTQWPCALCQLLKVHFQSLHDTIASTRHPGNENLPGLTDRLNFATITKKEFSESKALFTRYQIHVVTTSNSVCLRSYLLSPYFQ